MKMKHKALSGICTLSIAIILFGSCSADPNSPGLEYMPDMYRSPAIEPYVDYGEIRGRIQEDKKNETIRYDTSSWNNTVLWQRF